MKESLETSPEELQNWFDNPITKHLFDELNDTKESLKDHIAEGNTLEDGSTAKYVGMIEGLNQAFIVMSDVKEDVPHG